jgi:putative glutamine amidotransferase
MFNKKKVIGITGPSVYSPEIQKMVEKRFNAIPLMIHQNKLEDLALPLSHIDGLLLAGGRDICPLFYGKEITNGDGLSNFDLDRDNREKTCVEFCFEKDIPILGVCRGHQFLGIHCGLYLVTDITGSEICHSPFYSKIELDGLPCHFVECLPKFKESFFEKEYVNSFHHQAIWFSKGHKPTEWFEKSPAEILGFARTQYKAGQKDEELIVELMRGRVNRWISCQWHPELNYEDNKASQKVLEEFELMLA